jgi:hypothetical protein
MAVVQKSKYTGNQKLPRYEGEFNITKVKLYIAEKSPSSEMEYATYEKIRFEIDKQIEILDHDGTKKTIADGLTTVVEPAKSWREIPENVKELNRLTEAGPKRVKLTYYVSVKPSKENPEIMISRKKISWDDLPKLSIMHGVGGGVTIAESTISREGKK